MKVRSIRREIRILRVYALVSTVAAGAFLLGAVHEAKNASFDTITVHRINVVEDTGTLRLVISSKDHFPPPIAGGKVVTRENPGLGGIVFYNDRGDENGALAFKGDMAGGVVHAQSMLNFDDFQSNEAVQFVYNRNGGKRDEGMIIRQQADVPIATFRKGLDAALALPKGSQARAAALDQLSAEGAFGWMRMFTGLTEDGNSVLYLADGKGHPRLGFSVAPGGEAKIEFLDEKGAVTREISATSKAP